MNFTWLFEKKKEEKKDKLALVSTKYVNKG